MQIVGFLMRRLKCRFPSALVPRSARKDLTLSDGGGEVVAQCRTLEVGDLGSNPTSALLSGGFVLTGIPEKLLTGTF